VEELRFIPSNIPFEKAPSGSGEIKRPIVDDQGRLVVVALDPSAAAVNESIYDEINAVPKDTETTIVSFTVPLGRTCRISGGSASGKTDAAFKLYIDGVLKEKLLNAWTDRNVSFKAIDDIEEGKEIKITVEHWANNVHNFNGSIFISTRG